MTSEEVAQMITHLGLPSFRVKQVLEWLYKHGVQSYDEMTNLPLSMREKLSKIAPLKENKIIDKQISRDGTRKYIIELYDGAFVEMVAMPYPDRLTVCFSTQVGCSMDCSFCATGKEGLTRNLGPGEIIDQVLLAQRDFNRRVTNLVAMGQGEPFGNYSNTLEALKIINNPAYLGIGARHITVSTCGIIKGIEKFAFIKEQFTLAVSLHSAVQKTRDELMPKLKLPDLDRLKAALKLYVEHTRRRITFEYIMISGLNDDEEHLTALCDYCSDILCNVNLIPLNAIDDEHFVPSAQKTLRDFSSALQEAGVQVAIRNSRGQDIAGACGQLKNKILQNS
ncbi:MAG: 23S rRNA (adenine(2503)-C(2))-methyltransferase RlmN [Eggerthellaceae bacterium]|nr:23S rRNA (adenine(2503)-C(2))-methyltransferase RlmN [Eggerthellaceae bacterium]